MPSSRMLLFISLSVAFSSVNAQNFNGFRSGNYSGVNGVFYNPANIADNRYKIDFNLLSVSTSFSNDQASYSIKKLSESFDVDSIKNQVFGKDAGASSGIVNADIHGPSLMFATGQKMGFALTTRARVIGNITDLDGKLADKLTSDFNNDPELPYNFSYPGNMRVNVHAWTEFGLGIGRVISDKGHHFFKTGINLKYLAGAGNTYLNISGINTTIDQDLANQDAYLRNTTGTISAGAGGFNVDDFEVEQLTKMESTGFGADIGCVYEFRPHSEEYRLDSSTWQRDMNKYKVKIGVSLLDFGSIKYDKDPARTGAYNIDITNNERLYLDQLSQIEIDEFKSFFDSRPQFFTPVASAGETSYKVSLPTTLHLDVDYHFNKGFYLNMEAMLALKNDKDKIFDNYYYSSFIATPRYEGRGIGLYLPVSYNKLSGLNAGASFRFGPLFFGSSSAFSALLGDSKQIDVHFGLRFGGLYHSMLSRKQKKERKAAKEAAAL